MKSGLIGAASAKSEKPGPAFLRVPGAISAAGASSLDESIAAGPEKKEGPPVNQRLCRRGKSGPGFAPPAAAHAAPREAPRLFSQGVAAID